MKTKEEWIDQTMESLDGIGRAECDPALYGRLMDGMAMREPVFRRFSPAAVWKAAALILLLITLNILTLFFYPVKDMQETTSADSAASEYFSYINSVKL
jgi:hypothetical protein